MLTCNRLRIDPGIGSPAMDYRIENGLVERRTVEPLREGSAAPEKWQQLTPEELTSHVMAETIVARWLGRRMGFRWLIRACNQQSSAANNGTPNRPERIAA
jgi:hypothetical protein